jgi:hypothetical protein
MAPKVDIRPDPDRVAQQLDALYAELPRLDCKGKCWRCCARVLMAPGERDRLRREGVEVPTVEEMRREGRELCPALKSHRCTVYTARPLMCRLWGIEESMRCPYGCVPDGGWVSEAEAVRFWLRAYAIAGWPVEKQPRLNPREVAAELRRQEAKMAKLPGGGTTRIQPEGGSGDGGSRGARLPWRRKR